MNQFNLEIRLIEWDIFSWELLYLQSILFLHVNLYYYYNWLAEIEEVYDIFGKYAH